MVTAVDVVVSEAVVVVIAVVDVVVAGRTAFSSFDNTLQAPAAHSTAIQAATVPIAKPVLLFFVIMIPPLFLWLW